MITTTTTTTTLNDSASCVSDDHSIEFSLYEHDEEPMSETPAMPTKTPVYSDDVANDDDGEISLGANKKLSKPPPLHFLPKSSNYYDMTLLNMKLPQFITLILLLFITCFVASSYQQVLVATNTIEQVRLGESTLLVHLHKVEQQALQLAETLKRVSDRNDSPLPATEEDKSSAEVDSDLLRVQVEKLRDMEAELDHEVRALRKRIQQSAKQAMVQRYGQGAVQVFLQVETVVLDGSPQQGQQLSAKGGRNTLSIRLWYDTPHTVWTFLQQIENGVWNGATFSIQHGRSLVAEPISHNQEQDTRRHSRLEPSLDFVEASDRAHERYTVTLTDNNFAINLQDNKKLHNQEACVGVIFEGFDVLHKIVKDSTSSTSQQTVRIKQATASHMTRAETAGLI